MLIKTDSMTVITLRMTKSDNSYPTCDSFYSKSGKSELSPYELVYYPDLTGVDRPGDLLN
jgi:hypothetical protein